MEPVVVLRYESWNDWGQVDGYMLTRIKKRYALTCINHCSCHSTQYGDERDHTITAKKLIQLAWNKSDPRVPDTRTEMPDLVSLYDMILEFQEEILKNPKWVGPCRGAD
jgi:hypothetical protein